MAANHGPVACSEQDARVAREDPHWSWYVASDAKNGARVVQPVLRVQFPHHRADCTTVQKDSVAINWTKASDAEKLGAHCPQCLCLICPESGEQVVLASECLEWRTHCLAFNDGEGGYWRTMRRMKKEEKAEADAAAAAARGAGAGAAASSDPNGATTTGARRRALDKSKPAPPGTAKPPGKLKQTKKLA
eukprot:gene452-28710_t